MTSTAELKLSYFDGGERERSVNITFAEMDDGGGLNIRVWVRAEARPLAMVNMLAIGLDALLSHYGDQGVFTPLHDIQKQLSAAIQLTTDALVFEVEVLEKVRTIPITPEMIEKLFGMTPEQDGDDDPSFQVHSE